MNVIVITNQNLQVIHKKLSERHPHITLKKIINHMKRNQDKKKGTEKNDENNQKTINKLEIIHICQQSL